ncbi:hypothetical protein HK405_014328 [Cladochytrium tenue]|nr:hypothetical protein HK405_014328 [Cladochytrium tenue]
MDHVRRDRARGQCGGQTFTDPATDIAGRGTSSTGINYPLPTPGSTTLQLQEMSTADNNHDRDILATTPAMRISGQELAEALGGIDSNFISTDPGAGSHFFVPTPGSIMLQSQDMSTTGNNADGDHPAPSEALFPLDQIDDPNGVLIALLLGYPNCAGARSNSFVPTPGSTVLQSQGMITASNNADGDHPASSQEPQLRDLIHDLLNPNVSFWVPNNAPSHHHVDREYLRNEVLDFERSLQGSTPTPIDHPNPVIPSDATNAILGDDASQSDGGMLTQDKPQNGRGNSRNLHSPKPERHSRSRGISNTRTPSPKKYSLPAGWADKYGPADWAERIQEDPPFAPRPEQLYEEIDPPHDKLGAFYQNLGRDKDRSDTDKAVVSYHSDTGDDRSMTYGTTSAGEGGNRHAACGGVAELTERGGRPGPSSEKSGQARQVSISPLICQLDSRRSEEDDSDVGGRDGLHSDNLGHLSHDVSEVRMSAAARKGVNKSKSPLKNESEAEHLNVMVMNSVARLYQVTSEAKEKVAKAVAAASGAGNNAATDKANNDAATYSALKELRSARLLEVEWAAMAGRAVATSVLDGLVSPVMLQHSVRDAARMYQHDGDWVLMVLEMFASYVASKVGRPNFDVDEILWLVDEEVGWMKDEEDE